MAINSKTREQHPYQKDIAAIKRRMNRIEGQAKGIQRMLDEDRYCIDIVQQLTALAAAADEVAMMIMENHIEGCVTNAIRERQGEPYIKELMSTIRKALKR
jgi:CsoR family transcriptional regulator, copper-sensing transcriptional repressor